MQVKVNGNISDIPPGQSLARLLANHDIDPATVVVELNGRIITDREFDKEQIPESATIEIVHFVGGG